MNTAEAATPVKGSLNGLNTVPDSMQGAVQAGEKAASSLAQGTGDAIAGASGIMEQTDNLFSWSGYFQTLAILFLIIAIMFTALWYLRRKGGIKLLTGQGNLQIESLMSLGPKKQLVVVRFLNKLVLLGVTDQQITMLTELPINEDHAAHNSPATENTADFKVHLAEATQCKSESSG